MSRAAPCFYLNLYFVTDAANTCPLPITWQPADTRY